MIVTWNLSSHVKKYRGADVLALSVGKSGRTWLRVLLNKYLSLHYGVPFGINDLHQTDPAIPSVLFDHEIWSHYCDATWWHRALGSNVVPHKLLLTKKVVLMYRDPRDVVVSLYFHKTKRSRRRMQTDIASFIHDRHYGVDNIVRVMNLWRQRLADHPQCLWLRYEAVKADPVAQLAQLLQFMEVPNVDDAKVKQAIDFADFENMKKMEATNAFGSAILSARNPGDPDSFKVREGKVGGYAKHFGPAEIDYLNRSLLALDRFFDYRPD